MRTLSPFCILALLFAAVLPLTAPSAFAGDPHSSDMAQHEPFIRRCYELALSAAKKGNHPFGAVLVHKGKIILDAENTTISDNDFTHHAEMNLIAEAARTLPRQIAPDSTVYTSCAPCPMCTATLAISGITRIVYGVSYDAFNKRFGLKGKTMPGSALCEAMGTKVEFIGPVLETDGLRVFDFWPKSDTPAHQVSRTKARGGERPPSLTPAPL